LAGVQSGRLSRNGSTAASFSAIPQTSVVLPSRMWKTWVYYHSAFDPSRSAASYGNRQDTSATNPRSGVQAAGSRPGRWRAVNRPHLVALVRAGARFDKEVMVERPDEVQEVAA
jgi:hypothetical protein